MAYYKEETRDAKITWNVTVGHDERNRKASKTTVIKTVKGQKDWNAEHSINSDGSPYSERTFLYFFFNVAHYFEILRKWERIIKRVCLPNFSRV